MRPAAALLWGLWVTLCVACTAKTASLSLVPNQGGQLHRTLERRDASYDFYYHDGRLCKKCPPGTFVAVHCTNSGAQGICRPCPDDTFFQHKNQYETCSNCKICRSLDEVELKPCTKTSNTQCACKNGSFCSSSFPCETCHKCSPRCPDGEVMVRPCTPESDIQCEKTSKVTPATPAAGSSGNRHWIFIGISMAVCAFVIGAVCLCVKRSRAANVTESRVTVCSPLTFQRLKRKFNLQQSRDPDGQNPQVDQRSPNTDETSTMASLLDKRNSAAERRLVPQNGRDPLETLRQSFETFIKEVPLNRWKRFMRAIGLTDNEIEIAEMDEKGVHDQHFQMLRTWLTKKGKDATLDTLLEKLCDIELRGVEKTIRDELITQGLYCYEGSPCESCTDRFLE